MRLSGLQKILWVFAGVAAPVFAWLLLWSDDRSDRAGTGDAPPFFADFELTDHRGMVRTGDDFAERWMLVFFGLSNCPDVCPTALSDISGWLDETGEDAARLNVIFIAVDPERDRVEAMAGYVGYFHPPIRGWTGPQDQIARAADGFRATYEKVQTKDGEYTMNHTASGLPFDAEGQFVTMIDNREPREFAVPKIRRALQEEVEKTT